MTYADLEEQACKAASVLHEQGTGEGSVVGIALRDGQQAITAMLGTWLLGGTCNLLDFRSPPNDKQSAYEKFNHVLLLEDHSQTGNDYPGMAIVDWAAALERAPAIKPEVVESDAPAYISVTSGTTGVPSNIEVTHEAMLSRSASWKDLDIGQIYKRYLSTAPMAFSGTQGWVINSLLAGGTVVFFPTVFRPQDLFAAFDKYNITGCALVPTVLRDLLGYAREAGAKFSTAEIPPWLVTHGASIQPAELANVRELLSPNVLQIYGSWGAGPMACLDLRTEMDKLDTVGRPHAGVVIEIIDQNDSRLPQNSIGRIRVRTPGQGKSVAGSANVTGSDAFIGEWYYPGDVGLIDEDGYLKLIGRSGDLIIRGGVNVFPQEIETVAANIQGVKQVAVVGYHDERMGEEIALFAVTDPIVTVTTLHEHFRTGLPPDKRPKRIHIISEMPTNANGKIVKKRLLEMLERL